MSVSRRFMHAAVAIGAALGLLVSVTTSAGALGIYTSGYTGHDISFPQCGGAYPVPASSIYGVVGLNNGRAFRQNPCFASQYAWATGQGAYSAAVVAPEAVYLNLNRGYRYDRTIWGERPVRHRLPPR